MAKSKPGEQTLEQIEAEITKRNAAVDENKAALHALNKQRDVLIARAAAAERVAKLSPLEREAMKAELTAG